MTAAAKPAARPRCEICGSPHYGRDVYGIQFHLDKAHDRVDALEAELASYKGGEATALRLLEKAEARVRELERWKATAFPILARIDEKARETEGD